MRNPPDRRDRRSPGCNRAAAAKSDREDTEPHPITTAASRHQAQRERLAWNAYRRALRLQEDEPGLEAAIIRNATFAVWERAFLAGAAQ